MYPTTANEFDFANLRRAASSSNLLAPEEEQQLAIAAHGGDAHAFDRLVRAHLRLVFAMASEYRSFGLPAEDLISEGLLALVTAARRFEPDRGSRLAVYAAHWIRSHLRRFTLHNRRMVGPPSTRRGRLLIARLSRAEHELSQALGEPPDRDAIAAYVGMLPHDVDAVRLALRARDASVSDGEEHEPGTFVPISADPSPEAIVEEFERRAQTKAMLARGFEALTPRERDVVRTRCLQVDPPSLAVMSTSLGVSRERVRQIEERGYHKLRDAVLCSELALRPRDKLPSPILSRSAQ